MKKTVLLLTVLLCSLTQGQFWENPNQKPSLFGMRINRAHILGDPVALWLMSENKASKVYDLSGNGNTGTFNGDPQWGACKFGSGIIFDGTGDYVAVPDSPSLSITDKITMVAWFRTTDVSSRGIVAKSSLSNDYGDYNLYIGGGECIFLLNNNDKALLIGNNNLVVDTWYCVAGTYDGANMYGYLDGVQYGPTAYSTAIQNTASSLIIGGYYSVSYLLPGQISHVLIYNRALSASEIALLYREPFCFMESSWDWLLYGGISPPAVGAPQVIFIN